MAEDEKQTDVMSDEITADSEAAEEQGPVHDPKNGLYTVISIIIGIALCVLWQLVLKNISFTYSMYKDSFTDDEYSTLIAQAGFSESLPEESELVYARLSHGYDNNTLYIVIKLPEPDEDSELEYADFLPFEYSLSEEDSRFTIFPDENMEADFVYGNSYVDINAPKRMAVVYEKNGEMYAELRMTEYDGLVTGIMKDGVRTNLD